MLNWIARNRTILTYKNQKCFNKTILHPPPLLNILGKYPFVEKEYKMGVILTSFNFL